MSHAIIEHSLNLGESFSLSFVWLDHDESPRDLSGCSASFHSDSLEIHDLDLNIDEENSRLSLEIVDTKSWKWGAHKYVIRIAYPDATKDIILVGKIELNNVPIFETVG